jgi:hypothetical protein
VCSVLSAVQEPFDMLTNYNLYFYFCIVAECPRVGTEITNINFMCISVSLLYVAAKTDIE